MCFNVICFYDDEIIECEEVINYNILCDAWLVENQI